MKAADGGWQKHIQSEQSHLESGSTEKKEWVKVPHFLQFHTPEDLWFLKIHTSLKSHHPPPNNTQGPGGRSLLSLLGSDIVMAVLAAYTLEPCDRKVASCSEGSTEHEVPGKVLVSITKLMLVFCEHFSGEVRQPPLTQYCLC